MTEPITWRRGTESLKTAARWPGADRAAGSPSPPGSRLYQESGPFKFLIYAGLAGAEIGPVE